MQVHETEYSQSLEEHYRPSLPVPYLLEASCMDAHETTVVHLFYKLNVTP